MPPPDPNKKMEDLLRAYAKKRREEAGTPFDLSPDVRARLQEEVRRALGKTAVQPRPNWGLSLAGWLKVGMWGAVAAAVVLVLVNNGATKAKSKQFVEARKKAAAPELTSAAPAPVVVATTPVADAGPVQMTNRLLAADEPVVLAATRQPGMTDKAKETETVAKAADVYFAAGAGPATNVVVTVDSSNTLAANAPGGRRGRGGRGGQAGGGGGGGFGGGGGGGGGFAGNVIPQGAPAATPATSAPSAASGRMEIAAAVQAPAGSAQTMTRSERPLSQAVARAEMRRAQQSPPAAADVLASFQIERTGQEVRIIDSDGSVYRGPVVNTGNLSNLQTANQAEAAKDLDKLNGATKIAQDRAYGNNLALQKNNGYVDATANQGELPPKIANSVALQNQGAIPYSDALKAGGPALSGAGSAFTFQASGLNRKLNQNVTITGSCVIAGPPPGAGVNNSDLSSQEKLRVSNYGMAPDLKAAPARPPASQSQNIIENNALNYKNAQNFAPAVQYWRVTGQVQVGPSNHFDLDAATVHP